MRVVPLHHLGKPMCLPLCNLHTEATLPGPTSPEPWQQPIASGFWRGSPAQLSPGSE